MLLLLFLTLHPLFTNCLFSAHLPKLCAWLRSLGFILVKKLIDEGFDKKSFVFCNVPFSCSIFPTFWGPSTDSSFNVSSGKAVDSISWISFFRIVSTFFKFSWKFSDSFYRLWWDFLSSHLKIWKSSILNEYPRNSY